MKEKIMMLIIGILIGAIITAGCFIIFNKNNSQNKMMRFDGMENFNPEDIQNMKGGRQDKNFNNGDGNEQSEMPNGEFTPNVNDRQKPSEMNQNNEQI